MSTTSDIAPRLARAHAAEQERRMDGISRCWQGGWHANMAGPCFDTVDAAIRYRNREDRAHLVARDRHGLVLQNERLRARLLWRLGENPSFNPEAPDGE